MRKNRGCVVTIYCICVVDTLNQTLKSLCAHSIAASMKSFNWQWANVVTVETSLGSLSAMQGIGMHKHHSHCVFCHRVHFCMYVINTGRNVGSKHTASEREVLSQATRAAHTGANKAGKTLEMPRMKPEARLWDLHHSQREVRSLLETRIFSNTYFTRYM